MNWMTKPCLLVWIIISDGRDEKMIDFRPTKCNLCGGKVIYTSNAAIYGRQYGSGYCYLCTSCGAFVGTHVPHPEEALGILADEKMRKAKIRCHDLFDIHWKDKGTESRRYRNALYRWLAKRLRILVEECHFGYFDLDMLKKAYSILEEVKDMEMSLNARGRARFRDKTEREEL